MPSGHDLAAVAGILVMVLMSCALGFSDAVKSGRQKNLQKKVQKVLVIQKVFVTLQPQTGNNALRLCRKLTMPL